MRLDYDCARNIMLTIESLESHQYLMTSNCNSFPLLEEYPADQIGYTVARLAEAGFIPNYGIVPLVQGNIHYEVNHLTWEGHQYLDCIRNKAPWEKSHLLTKFLDSVPFKVLCELALQDIRRELGLTT